MAAVEIVQNRSFDGVLVGWGLPEILGQAIPYSAEYGAAHLHPDGLSYDYRGTVLWQPLQVAVLPGDTFEVSVDLRAAWMPPEGKTVAVYLEYADAGLTRHRIKVLNPDNQSITNTAWTRFTALHVPPVNLTKLVGLAFDTEGDGYFLADNVSVLSPRAGTPVPALGSVAPENVAYGGSVVIRGEHFGGTAGRVTLGTKTNGVVIQSWTDKEIVIGVQDPSAGGALVVEAGGVRSWQPRKVTISSPNYVLAAQPEKSLATPGQLVQVAIFADFKNGFAPAGGLACSVSSLPNPAVASFSPATVLRAGGTLLQIDTTSLAPGRYDLKVQAVGGGLLPRECGLVLDLRQIASVELLYRPASDLISLAGATLTEQGGLSFYRRVLDTNGVEITWDIPPLPVSSSNPTVLDVFQDPAPWANNSLLVHASGAVSLTAITPDGRTWNTALTVAVPALPAFVSAGFVASPMVNTPGTTNRFTFVASDPMSGLSWGFASLGASIEDSQWGDEAKSFTGTFVLNEYAKLGDYLFYAAAQVGGQPRKISQRLNVINAPGTGMVRGHVAQHGGSMYGHGASGTLEFCDPATGTVLFTRNLWEWSNNYTAVHLAPGTYKLRWVPQGFGADLPLPQWYPNAAAAGQASSIVVSAGTIVSNVNFFLSPPNVPAPPTLLTEPPTYGPGLGYFTLKIQTEAGASYELHKSTTLLDHSWWPLSTAYGDGQAQTLQDLNASGPVGFYRVIRK